MLHNNPLISVIITTKNEEKNIANCLKSILEQSYKNIEIIVVDNNSTDRTKEIVDQMSLRGDLRIGSRRSNLSISFFTHGPERSAQRNFGVRKAKGKYILYLDADMILSKNVVKDCVNEFKNFKFQISNFPLVALYISEIVMGESFWCKVRRFERSFYDGTVIDCVRFVSKAAFDAVGGFDEGMSGPEDWDFDKKIRQIGKTDLIKTPIYHNEQNFNLLQYLNKKSYYIKSFDKYINKWGKNDADIKRQLGFYYRYFGVFVENGRWKRFLFFPILTIGMLFLRVLVGLCYILKKIKIL